MRRIVAIEDPGLSASVVGSRGLYYSDGADAELDRPAHVRAGSAVAWWGGRLAVVQDDASWIALVDPVTGVAEPLALPARDGVRLFGTARGNKDRKLDLEAVVVADGVLYAFGSGSTSERTRIVRAAPDGAVDVLDATALYARLGATVAFAGASLNVEGAVLIGEGSGRVLRLYQRGNGRRAVGDLATVSATADLSWNATLRYLAGDSPPPEPTDIVQYALGDVSGVPLAFTDAAARGSSVVYLAASEDSPDTYDDGPVTGLAIGVLDDRGARYTAVTTADGSPVAHKAEGIALDGDRAWIVIDADDPEKPCELLEVALSGFGGVGRPGRGLRPLRSHDHSP